MKFNNYKGKNNIRWGILGKQKVYTAAPVLQEKKETASSFEPFNSKKDDFVRIDLIPRFVVGGGQSTISPSPSATPIPPSATPTMTPTPTVTPTCGTFTTQYLEVVLSSCHNFSLKLYNNPNFTSNATAICDYIVSGTAYGDMGTVYTGTETIITGQHSHNFNLNPVLQPGECVSSFDVHSVTPQCPCVLVNYITATPTPTPTNTTTPTITPTPSTTPSIYGPNLKMYLDASDTNSYNGSGTIWYDLTPNNNHAIMSGDSNSIFITTGSTSYFSLNFTATSQNQYFIVPDSNSLDVTSGITMEIWVNRNSVNTSNASLFNKQDNPGWGGRYGEYSFRFSGLGIETWVGGYFEGPAYGNPTNIPLDSWNQLVITWDTSDYSYRYYINGTLQSTSSPTTATSIPTSIYPLWLGANLAGVNENFTGYISIVRLYNKALSSVEVNNNWLADKTKFGL